MAKISKEHKEVLSELNDLYSLVQTGDPFKYRPQFEQIRDKYFESIGEDPCLDFNLVAYHIRPNPDFLTVHKSLGTKNNEMKLFVENWDVIRDFTDPATVIESFMYLNNVYDHYNSLKNEVKESRIILEYLLSSVEMPASAGRVVTHEDMVDSMRSRKFVQLWDKMIKKE